VCHAISFIPRRTKRPRNTLPPFPVASVHDSGVSTPVHLVQTGKIIVEERRRKKFPCGTHIAVLVAAVSTSVTVLVEYRIVWFSFLFSVPSVRPDEFYCSQQDAGIPSFFAREVRRSFFMNSFAALFVRARLDRDIFYLHFTLDFAGQITKKIVECAMSSVPRKIMVITFYYRVVTL